MINKRDRNHFENIENNNCNNSNNSCNNNNNNNNNLIKLFNSVFNNIYIKKLIFFHLNIFNIFLPVNIKFKSFQEWQQFKYKEYLYSVTLDFSEEYDINQLPENINHINIRPYLLSTSIIPNHIQSINYSKSVHILDLKYFTTNPKLNSINIMVYGEDQVKPNFVPPSVTELSITQSSGIKLLKNSLPKNLKKLFICKVEEIQDGALPIKSLTSISLVQSNPLLINQLSSIIGLVKLEFFSTDLIIYDIDSSVQFPDTLQILSVFSNKFNAKLPSNLKILKLNIKSLDYEIEVPSSLENLSLLYETCKSNIKLFQNHQQIPPNLKSLKVSQYSSITNDNGQLILPDTLERLEVVGFSFNEVLQANQLPSSLKFLYLGDSFNQVIEVGVLPSNLEKLILGGKSYSQVINPLAIPPQLKLLQISNQNYDHPIQLTSITHPNTLIKSMNNFNLLKRLLDNSDKSSLSDFIQIHQLRLSDNFQLPLSKFQQQLVNLEYINFNYLFKDPLELVIPIQNIIKIIEFSGEYKQVINLEYFQNLERIIINNSIPIIKTTKINNHYHYYKLKYITVPLFNTQFIKQLDNNFYQFIEYNK